MKIVFDDELQALMLLSSLPESWEILVVTVSNSAPEGVDYESSYWQLVERKDEKKIDIFFSFIGLSCESMGEKQK